jgi:hypothetical protein
MAEQDPKPAQMVPQLDENLSADEIQLRAQGHVGELPRQFSPLSTLALAFSITNTWVGYAATFVTPLYAGAGPAVFWAPIIAFIASLLITLGLAELASAFPSSGGQYHAAFLVSPPKYRAAIGFTVGWLSCFAWLFTVSERPTISYDLRLTISDGLSQPVLRITLHQLGYTEEPGLRSNSVADMVHLCGFHYNLQQYSDLPPTLDPEARDVLLLCEPDRLPRQHDRPSSSLALEAVQ